MRMEIAAVLLLLVSGCGGSSGDGAGGSSGNDGGGAGGSTSTGGGTTNGGGTGSGATPPVNASGLDSRPPNPDCLAGAAPSVSLSLQPVFTGLGNFTAPLFMVQEPASADRWYVGQQDGRVFEFDNRPDVSAKRLFVDLNTAIAGVSYGEMGLLGMAFHPGWPTDPRVYFSYTTYLGSQLVSQLVEYQTRDGGQTADPATARVLLQVNQPATNHNGGDLAFGPDGYLYLGLGDGGETDSGDDHGLIGNGQNLSTLLGKMVRIDVDHAGSGMPYAIPATNPFAGGALCNNDVGAYTGNCPEIYAYGFRNPWRWSFDRGSGELWLGDPGQDSWEEVDKVVLGGNYGWRCYEGSHSYNPSCGPNAGSAIAPVAEYSHAHGIAVIGGYVYRGTAIPELVGRFVFGDYGTGAIWDIARDTTPTLQLADGVSSGLDMVSFGQGLDGEIYVIGFSGALQKLVPGNQTGRVIPNQLSATGCVNPADPTQPASGLIPYAPNASFWSDGAVKTRFLALPDGKQISVGQDGSFSFPTGSVLVKNFSLGSRLVETRLLMRHDDGQWAGYTYAWNDAGTDATRVIGGRTASINGQPWYFPSEAQCQLCHTDAAGHTLALETPQLNGKLHYAATGRDANQLTTLNDIGLFTPALATDPAQLPSMPDPYGQDGTLAQRARSWLHTNCSQCHRPGGPTGVDMDLRYTTPLSGTNACDVAPHDTLGIADARRIAIGGSNPAARSLVVVRPGNGGSNAMPPVPHTVDTAGVQLLTDWVNSLTSCG